MLKFSYDVKSDIPEGLEKFYTEKDGKFTIQVEGMKTEDDVKSIQTALQKERETRRDAEKKLERFNLLPEDFDIEQYNRLKDEGGGKVEEKLSEQKKRLNEQFEKERETYKKQIADATGLVDKHVKEVALERGLAEINVGKQFTPAVRSMFKEQLSLDGEQVFLSDRPINDFLKDWSQSEDGKAFVVAPTNTGGGTNATGSKTKENETQSMPRSEFSNLPPDKKVEVSKKGVTLTNE